MRIFQQLVITASFLAFKGLGAYEAPPFPYAPAAGEEGSTAIAFDAPGITGWATGVQAVQFGEDVAEEWRTPEAALGPADTSGADVVVLGRGGAIVLSFERAIVDDPGDDFAVFENSFSSTFLNDEINESLYFIINTEH